MKYPKELTVELPKIEYPKAVLVTNERVNTPGSEKDFCLGELYIPSSKDETKLSPRRDVSPSIFNSTRKERRNHPSNFDDTPRLRKKVIYVQKNSTRNTDNLNKWDINRRKVTNRSFMFN